MVSIGAVFGSSGLTATAPTNSGADAATSNALSVPLGPARVAPDRCPDNRRGLAYYRGRYAAHRAVRGLRTPYPVGRKPRNCADAGYLADLWQSRAFQARRKTEAWVLEQRTLREQPTWIRAIREAQKAYPGTEWWLRSCSSTEGAGRGLSINWFQMNHEGSGAGGWLQFMESTFRRMWSSAEADVRARGFRLKGNLARWSSRTGQALAGAWGLLNGRRGEWSGSGC